jgi:hypothetical protein
MRKRRINDQTQTTRINENAFKKSMKKLFTRIKCQEVNHREKKKRKFKKKLKFLQISRRFFDDSLVERALKIINLRKSQSCRI